MAAQERRTPDPLVGRTIGDFALQELIARGGQAWVYRAEQNLLGREAAVKVLPGKKRSKLATARFLREIHLASRLDHPYAAHIYAFGAESDVLWVAMELVRGTPLNRLLKEQGPMSVERFVPLLQRICEVVHSAHEQGIIHRDIKPSNVMVLARAGRLLPKLLDFGIAKAADAGLTRADAEHAEGKSGPALAPVIEFSEPIATYGESAAFEPPLAVNDDNDQSDNDGDGDDASRAQPDDSTSAVPRPADDDREDEAGADGAAPGAGGERAAAAQAGAAGAQARAADDTGAQPRAADDTGRDRAAADHDDWDDSGAPPEEITPTVTMSDESEEYPPDDNPPTLITGDALERHATDELTFLGHCLGTPAYMAPELWRNAKFTGAWTDIYSLGVLAYEALTGRRPFKASSLSEWKRAHEVQPVPSPGGALSPAIEAVLARAMAKQPSQRHGSAIEFAEELAKAAGAAETQTGTPELDEVLRDALIGRSAQPIAECAAALESARSLHQAWDATWQLVHTMIQYLGVIALACRVKLGEPATAGGRSPDDAEPDGSPPADATDDAADASDASEILAARARELDRGGLTDAGWLDLAREVCRPYARAPETFPVPELVAALFEPDGGERDSWDALLARRRRPAETEPAAAPSDTADPDAGPQTITSTGTDAEPRTVTVTETDPRSPVASSAGNDTDRPGTGSDDAERLAGVLADLSRVVRSLSLLMDYSLVVTTAGGCELWMGTRRSARPVVEVAGRPPEDGEILLLDPERAPVVRVSPFAAAASPMPGADRELFLFEGRGRRGAVLRAFPAGFERHESGFPWSALRHSLGLASGDIHAGDDEEKPPYRGLSTFGPEDASIFHGREREVEAFANRLRAQSLLAVVGPSGSGKSSFVQAGVIPSLPVGWRAITVRPGHAPLSALCSRLARAGLRIPRARALRRRDPSALADALRAALKSPGDADPDPDPDDRDVRNSDSRLVIVIDQLEELFTLCLDEDERAFYARALLAAAGEPTAPIRVIVTLRDDFLMRATALPGFRDRIAQSVVLLTTPAREELLRILLEPARQRGYRFEPSDLPETMVDAVTDQPGALALLSFTAEQLWERRDRDFKQLTGRAYERMGGVGGALAKHAEAVLDGLGPEEHRMIREAFRHLVTGEGTRAVLSRAELVQLMETAR